MPADVGSFTDSRTRHTTFFNDLGATGAKNGEKGSAKARAKTVDARSFHSDRERYVDSPDRASKVRKERRRGRWGRNNGGRSWDGPWDWDASWARRSPKKGSKILWDGYQEYGSPQHFRPSPYYDQYAAEGKEIMALLQPHTFESPKFRSVRAESNEMWSLVNTRRRPRRRGGKGGAAGKTVVGSESDALKLNGHAQRILETSDPGQIWMNEDGPKPLVCSNAHIPAQVQPLNETNIDRTHPWVTPRQLPAKVMLRVDDQWPLPYAMNRPVWDMDYAERQKREKGKGREERHGAPLKLSARKTGFRQERISKASETPVADPVLPVSSPVSSASVPISGPPKPQKPRKGKEITPTYSPEITEFPYCPPARKHSPVSTKTDLRKMAPKIAGDAAKTSVRHAAPKIGVNGARDRQSSNKNGRELAPRLSDGGTSIGSKSPRRATRPLKSEPRRRLQIDVGDTSPKGAQIASGNRILAPKKNPTERPAKKSITKGISSPVLKLSPKHKKKSRKR